MYIPTQELFFTLDFWVSECELVKPGSLGTNYVIADSYRMSAVSESFHECLGIWKGNIYYLGIC
jgi:hypothetical protein